MPRRIVSCSRPDLWNPVGYQYAWLTVDNGDRLPALGNWSNAGVWASGVKGIPTYPVSIDLTGLTSYGGHPLDPTGAVDSTAAINAAWTACSPGYAVLLPAGTFKVTSALYGKAYTVLRGSGAGLTKIATTASIPDGVIALWGSYTMGGQPAISSGYTKGSDTIVVADPTGYVAGDIALIDQLNDATTPVRSGYNGNCDWCDIDGARGGPNPGTRVQLELCLVKSVVGNTITLSRGQYMTRSAALSPRVSKFAYSVLMNAGVENLSVVITGNPTGTPAIGSRYSAYCWAKGCEVTGFTSSGLELALLVGFEGRRNYIHDSTIGAGDGYGTRLAAMTSDCLIEDNIYDYTHGSVVYYSGAGNVIGYNYTYSVLYNTTWLQSSIIDHSAHPYMTLSEGNIVGQHHGDSFWGSASHNMQFRNHFTMLDGRITPTQNLAPVVLDCFHTRYSFVGNVLGTPAFSGSYENVAPAYPNSYIRVLGYDCCKWYPSDHYDATVETTLLWHGNYDYAHDAVVWDPLISGRDIPLSLYLPTKPSWFGSLPWPGIGPDVSGLSNSNPAKHRFDTWWAAGHNPASIAALFANEA